MKRIAILLAFTACVAFAASFSACVGEDDPAAGDASVAPDDAAPTSSSSPDATGDGAGGPRGCAAFAKAACDREARCSPLRIDIVFGTMEACREAQTILCDRMTTAPGASAFPASCITALETGCGDYLTPSPLECSPKGTLTDDAPCEFDNQCASGRCGSSGGTPGCGRCSAASDASIANAGGKPQGSSCTNEGNCASGLSCIGASTATMPTPGTCEPTRAIGEACLEAEDCNTASHGDFGWMGFKVACLDGGCAEPLGEGAECAAGRAFAQECDIQQKLRCSAGKCTKWPFATTNEPCTPNGQTPSGTCSGDHRCVGDAGSTTCVLKGAAGSPCTVEYDCRWGLSCDANVCAIRPADYCK